MIRELYSRHGALALCACLALACEAESRNGFFGDNLPPADDGGTGDPTGGTGGTDTGTGDGTTGSGAPTGSDDDGQTGDGTSGDTSTEEANVCGDGVLDSLEACDGELFGDVSCESEGWDGGELLCNDWCTGYSTEGCYSCGNGILEGPETCDGGVGTATCESEGFTEGEVTCDEATCELDTSACTLCGDGTPEGNEECDTDNLNAETCESLGYIEGTLACGEECSYDTTACISDDYVQDFESGALGPEWTLGGSANWFASSLTPIAGTYSAESGNIGDSQSTDLSLTLEYNVAGDISFWHRESCESGWDYLHFYIDNVQQGSWTGINVAAQATYPVAAGTHTFRWTYIKDSILDGGTDTVWIDDILATGGGIP